MNFCMLNLPQMAAASLAVWGALAPLDWALGQTPPPSTPQRGLPLCPGNPHCPASSPAKASAVGNLAKDYDGASATSAGVDTAANHNTRIVTNGPVADTPENRRSFPPLSEKGRGTKPRGN